MTDSTPVAAPEPAAAMRRSPAAHLAEDCRAAETAGVRLVERGFLAQVELRLDPGEHAVARRIGAEFLGCALPATAAASGDGRPYVLGCGPGWYLVVDSSPEVTGWGLASGLRAVLGGEYGAACASVVDVSAQRTVLELSGVRAADVLSHGCPLDLHPSVFGPLSYAQTLLGKAAVGLLQADAAPTYWILVRASFADYLTRWLLDAMTEY